MTDRPSLVLILLAVLAIGSDVMLWQTGFPLFLARKGADLVEYLTFLR